MRHFSDITLLVEDLPESMAVKELAEALNVGATTIYEYINNLNLPVIPIPGPVRIMKKDFLKWIEIKKGGR
jgi:excisionase family DNA binding protein